MKNKYEIKEMVSRYLKEASMEQRLSGKASDSPTYKGKERRKRDPLYTTKKSLEADAKRAAARRNDEITDFTSWKNRNKRIEDAKKRSGMTKLEAKKAAEDKAAANKAADDFARVLRKNKKKKKRKDELSETAQRDRSKDRKPWDRPTPTTKKTGSVFDPKSPKPAPTTETPPDPMRYKKGPPRKWPLKMDWTEYEGPSLSEQADYIDWFLNELAIEKWSDLWSSASQMRAPRRRGYSKPGPAFVNIAKSKAKVAQQEKKTKFKKKSKEAKDTIRRFGEQADYIARFLEEGKRWKAVKGAVKKLFKRKIKDTRSPDQIERDQARRDAFDRGGSEEWKKDPMSKMGPGAKTDRSHQIRGKQKG